jgi:predicted amidohydrolase YtcJ
MAYLHFTNGTFWSGDNFSAHSLLVNNGIIQELDSKSPPGDAISIDLEGAFIMPAFADGHAHPLFAGRESQGPQVTELPTLEETLRQIKLFADKNPDESWIVGGAYDAALVPNGNFDAKWIDAIVPDRPVLLHAMDHHTIWVNTKAMEIANVNDFHDDLKVGTIERNPDGSPLGTFREWDAINLITKHLPPRKMEDEIKAIEFASDRFAKSGVTWVQDAWVDPGMSEAYIEASKRNRLKIGYNLAFRADPDTWREDIEYILSQQKIINSLGENSNLTAFTIKFFADGVIEGGTAVMLDEYCDHPGYHGMPVWELENLIEAVIEFDKLGFQIFIHAIGDGGVRNALDAIEAAQSKNSDRKTRHVITHLQLIDPADLQRLKTLGIIANFEPFWTKLDPMQMVLSVPRIGEDRASRQYQMRSILDLGIPLSFGSDWPVTSEVPFEGLAVAVHRQMPDRTPPGGWIPEEKISPQEALQAYTSGVAYQAFCEDKQGKLLPGFYADFIVIPSDPRLMDPHDMGKIEITATYRKGDCIYSKN